MLNRLRDAVRDRVIRHYGAGFDIQYALHRMRENNFNPAHIFDVGAYRGEFSQTCRRIWPNARLTCFEVLPQRVQDLRQWIATDGNSELFECLLGSECKTRVAFNEKGTASSVLPDHIPGTAPIGSHPMRTVDDIVANSNIAPPDLLKLDVQGYEYEVIMGARDTLRNISAVLAEVNLLDLYKGAHLLEDVVRLLSEHNFVAYDICGFWRRPLDNALWTADIIFVPENSFLRSDKRWSQRQKPALRLRDDFNV